MHPGIGWSDHHNEAKWYGGCQTETISIWGHAIYKGTNKRHMDRWIDLIHVILRNVDTLSGRKIIFKPRNLRDAWNRLRDHIKAAPP